MKILSKNIRILFVPIVLCAFSSSAVFFSLSFIKENNSKAYRISQDAEAEIKSRQAVKATEKLVLSTEQDRSDLGSHFAKSSNVAPFLDYIESLGAQAGTKTKISTVSISGNPSKIEVEIFSIGNFQNIFQLLLLLENSKYQIDFYSIRLSKPRINSPDKEWNGYFKIALISFIVNN